MTSKTVTLLQVIAWITLAGALVVGTTGDQNAQIILASLAGLSIIAYVITKELGKGTPRFLEARNPIILGLLAMVGGVGVTSAGSVQNELVNSTSAGLQLKIVGISMYLIGILGIIISLVISGTANPPEWKGKSSDTGT
jgi:hypothetical protein